jgi:antitoxin HicB
MIRKTYQGELEPREGGGYYIRLPDFPEAISEADDDQGVARAASELLEAAIAFRIEEGQALPEAAHEGGFVVPVPPLMAVKLAVVEAFRESGITQSELADRLGVKQPEVGRILNIHHATKLSRLEGALNALGKRVVVEIEPIAATA